MAAPTDTSPHTVALSGPTTQAAWTLSRLYAGVEGADLQALHRELLAQIDNVNGGNPQDAVARLTAQSTSLDGLFHFLLRRGLLSVDRNSSYWEPWVRLALKAQNQCRVTLESLARLNPQPASIVHNAAKENDTSIGRKHEQRLDTGTSASAGTAHPSMAALATRHRAEDCGGQG